jgi:hypothetical protein
MVGLKKGKTLYLKIPEGFEIYHKSFSPGLNRTVYGLKQLTQAFWSELLKVIQTGGFNRSNGNPCC